MISVRFGDVRGTGMQQAVDVLVKRLNSLAYSERYWQKANSEQDVRQVKYAASEVIKDAKLLLDTTRSINGDLKIILEEARVAKTGKLQDNRGQWYDPE